MSTNFDEFFAFRKIWIFCAKLVESPDLSKLNFWRKIWRSNCVFKTRPEIENNDFRNQVKNSTNFCLHFRTDFSPVLKLLELSSLSRAIISSRKQKSEKQ